MLEAFKFYRKSGTRNETVAQFDIFSKLDNSLKVPELAKINSLKKICHLHHKNTAQTICAVFFEQSSHVLSIRLDLQKCQAPLW